MNTRRAFLAYGTFKPVRVVVGEGYNPFEMPEHMANPYGIVGRAALARMGLSQV